MKTTNKSQFLLKLVFLGIISWIVTFIQLFGILVFCVLIVLLLASTKALLILYMIYLLMTLIISLSNMWMNWGSVIYCCRN